MYIDRLRIIQQWWKLLIYNPHTDRGRKFIWKQGGYKINN